MALDDFESLQPVKVEYNSSNKLDVDVIDNTINLVSDGNDSKINPGDVYDFSAGDWLPHTDVGVKHKHDDRGFSPSFLYCCFVDNKVVR